MCMPGYIFIHPIHVLGCNNIVELTTPEAALVGCFSKQRGHVILLSLGLVKGALRATICVLHLRARPQ